MTSYESKGPEPTNGKFCGFDHVHWWVGNAKQAASFYCARFGFEYLAYKGLETGERNIVTHVVRQGKIVFAFSSALNPSGAKALGDDLGRHLVMHGDGVKDVAFTVENCQSIFDAAVERGAEVASPVEEAKDEHGSVVMGSVKTYGDTVHTFVQRGEYSGAFLPGFKDMRDQTDALAAFTPPIGLAFIDHVVGNMPDGGMTPAVEYYERVMQFHRFWSVDDKQMHTEYSALRSVVMADYSHVIKMPINEPAAGKKKSQIQEYVDYYGSAGVQHIALNTPDIISAITYLRQRGVTFLSVRGLHPRVCAHPPAVAWPYAHFADPFTPCCALPCLAFGRGCVPQVPGKYYDLLEARLAKSEITVKEDMARLRALNILVDFDDKGCVGDTATKHSTSPSHSARASPLVPVCFRPHVCSPRFPAPRTTRYLLQIFTKPLMDRPTVFIEVIQRAGNTGFGAGNFKALFESIERDQAARGNLV